MLNCYNAREYTKDALSELLRTAGWKLLNVFGEPMFQDSTEQLTIAVPA